MGMCIVSYPRPEGFKSCQGRMQVGFKVVHGAKNPAAKCRAYCTMLMKAQMNRFHRINAH